MHQSLKEQSDIWDFEKEELDPEEYGAILNDPRTTIKQHDNYRSTDNMTRKQFDRT